MKTGNSEIHGRFLLFKSLRTFPYHYATLELCGPENLSASEMSSAMENVMQQKIELKFIPDDAIRNSMAGKKLRNMR